MANLFQKTLALYRKAYTGHPREIWELTILTFINRTGTMVLPFLSVYLTSVLNFTLKEAGVLASAFGLGSLAGSFIGGKLSDRWGPRPVMMLSLVGGGLMFILLQYISSFSGLFAFIFVTATLGDAYRPAMMSALGDFVPATKTARSVALLRLAVNLGISAGPALGGWVAITLGYPGLFWIDGLTCVAAAVYLWFASQHWRVPSHTDHAPEGEKPDVGPPAHQNPDYLLFLLATFLLGFCFVQWFHSVPVFLKSDWQYDEGIIGLLLGMNGLLIAAIEMPMVQALEDAGKSWMALQGGVILVGASFLAFFLPAGLVFCFGAMLLLTLGEILFVPFNNAIPFQHSPAGKRGDYMAWYWMTWSLTQVLGPLVGLYLAGEWGFQPFWVLIIGLAVFSFLLGLKVKERLRG